MMCSAAISHCYINLSHIQFKYLNSESYFISFIDTEQLSLVSNFIGALGSTSPKCSTEATASTSFVKQIVYEDDEIL